MFSDLKNSFDFYLRNILNFSRKDFVEKDSRLVERNIKENLYTKDILEKYFNKVKKENIKVLDIGSKNWFYAKGEHDFFSSFTDKFFLMGVEIDAYRLYSNFYNRYEVAKYHIKNLKNTKYIAGNLLDIKEKFDYIIWFLPFVLIEPHKMWGLPKKYFYPERLLNHAWSLLNEKGEMLIINQGVFEANAQRELLEKNNINYVDLGEITSDYFQYKNKRFGFLVKK